MNTTKEFMAYIGETGAAYAVCYSIQNPQERLLIQHLTDIDGCNLEPLSLLDNVRDKYFHELSQQIRNYTSFAAANRASTTNSCAAIFVVIFDAVIADEQIQMQVQGNNFIQLYSRSTGQFTAVASAILGKPHTPMVKETRSTSVTLSCPSWDVPDTSKGYNIHDGYYGIVSYQYHKMNSRKNEDVLKVPFSKAMVTVTVENLEPVTIYYFKLAIQCPYGRSEYSDISEPITTLLARPEKPEISRVKGKLNKPPVIKISTKPSHTCNTENYEYSFRIHKLTKEEVISNKWDCSTSIDVSSSILQLDHVYMCKVVARTKDRVHVSEPSEEREFVPNDFTEIGKHQHIIIVKYLHLDCYPR